MKVPKARKLPSGSWFIQMRLDGQSIPVTAATERECVRKAELLKSEIRNGRQIAKLSPMTVGDAFDKYIDSKDGSLSPSTIAGYKRIRQHSFQGIMRLPLKNISNEGIQREISKMSKDGKSPKTISNYVGLLSAVLKMHYPEFRISVSIPQRERMERIDPKESDIKAIADAVRGYAVELPTLLAMWMGLRMSEILGLTWADIDGDTLHIRQAKVDEGVKTTKTYGSKRDIHIPPYIKQLFDSLPHKGEYIFPVTRGSIYDSFQKYTKRAGIQHYRFHDLRHLNTTVQLLLGIDNKTITKRNGWSTDAMIKSVYGHTSDERKKLADTVIDDYFSGVIEK